MSILVIGGTGTLGRQIVKQALDEGYQVKCLVRDFRRGAFLKDWGAELIYGDLSIPSTIPTALKGVNTIIDSATIRSTSSYTSEAIDWRGKISFNRSSEISRYQEIYFFFCFKCSKEPINTFSVVKVEIGEKLAESGLNYTVFQCSGFFQGLISQYALPILENETIWLPSDSAPVAYLDTQDAAKAVVQSLDNVNYDQKNYFPYWREVLDIKRNRRIV